MAQLEVAAQKTAPPRQFHALKRFFQSGIGRVGFVMVVSLLLLALVGPYFLPYDFLQQDIQARYAAPSLEHILGTDDLGRDVLARVLYGARTALFIALGVTAVSLTIGMTVGAIAGYFGGFIDKSLMWLTDVTMSVPTLLLVIVVNSSIRPPIIQWMDVAFTATRNPIFRETSLVSLALVLIMIAVVNWPGYARLTRGQVLTVRNSNYIRGAVVIGLSTGTIIRRHLMPNAIGPVVIAGSFGVGNAMVLESAFSFLGVGIEPPIPSWGRMIADGMRVWNVYPHLLIAPAAMLGLATIGFAFLGQGLNDAINPKRARS